MIETDKYKLYQGDCLEVMDELIALGVEVDAIITDPPYGTAGTAKCKWDEIIPFDEMWKRLNRLIKKPNGAILLFGNQPFTSKLICSNIKQYKYDWYWHKSKSGNFIQANKMPHKKIEIISVFYDKYPTYNPQKINNPKGTEKRMTHYKPSKQKKVKEGQMSSWSEYTKSGKNYEPDKLLPTCLIEFKNVQKPIHPCQKPVLLLEYLIKTYTNEGELVLDFTMGSGSTGVACLNTNRRFIGIELDEKYFNIAKERLENLL